MSLAVSYNARYLITRKATTLLTLSGIALVVLVYVATLMLAEGLRQTLAGTGSVENAIVLQNGAQSEIQSGVTRAATNIILAEAEVARRPNNEPISSTDCVVVVSLKKSVDHKPTHATIRGISKHGLEIRPAVKIVSGRLFQPGSKEVIVGKAIHKRLTNAQIGSYIKLAGTEWPVIGVFDAGPTGFSSEIWGDVNVLMSSFKRDQFSSITFRLKDRADFAAMKRRLEKDPRLKVELKRENEFYESQSQGLADFIKLLGTVISVIFSLGAIIGALITMYSAVLQRTREIGILRALGFRAGSIFCAFSAECLLMALAGGVLGVTAAVLLSFVTINTVNFQTFAEISFAFRITPRIALQGLMFSLIMGFLGGALPAWRAAKVKIVEAIRTL